MNKEDAHIVVAMENHNMNVTDVARAIFAHRKVSVFAKTFFQIGVF